MRTEKITSVSSMPKKMLTDSCGPVEVKVPRDRAGTFEPVIVKKRQRRLSNVDTIFPQAIVQACMIHLIRATLRYASRKYLDQLAKDLRRIYTALSVEAAWAAFEELEEKWGKPYPAIPKM